MHRNVLLATDFHRSSTAGYLLNSVQVRTRQKAIKACLEKADWKIVAVHGRKTTHGILS
jgi:hypothetical protein